MPRRTTKPAKETSSQKSLKKSAKKGGRKSSPKKPPNAGGGKSPKTKKDISHLLNLQSDGLLKKAIQNQDLLNKLILCIDPGTDESGVVIVLPSKDGVGVVRSDKQSNDRIRQVLQIHDFDMILVEATEIHGMAGNSTAKTIFHCGRFFQTVKMSCKDTCTMLFSTRNKIKKSLLGRFMGTKDKHVREKCIAEFGTDKIKSEDFDGKEHNVSTDAWSALAVFLAHVMSPEIFSKVYLN